MLLTMSLSIQKKIFIHKQCKIATLEPFSRGMLNLRRSAARSITDANLNLEKNKKISLNLHKYSYRNT